MVDRFLHIYGQESWHEEAIVAGNREALIALADALRRAADDDGSPRSVEVFAGDGEGYEVFVVRVDEPRLGHLRTPYTADYAQDLRVDTVSPWQLIDEDEQGSDGGWLREQT